MENKVLYLTKGQMVELKDKRELRIEIAVPKDLLHIEKLEGEDHPSAWTIEWYIKNGKAYWKCTRLQPFGPRFMSRYIVCKVKYKKEAKTCRWEENGVFERDGDWFWKVDLKDIYSESKDQDP